MSSKKKIAVVVLTTVALSMGTVGVANASPAKSKFLSIRTTTTSRTVNAVANPMAAPAAQGQDAELKSVLAALVTSKTLTQAQADAILAALVAARATKPATHEVDDDADHNAKPILNITLIASTLGVDTATVTTGIAAGKSLATIAGAKRAALIAALVADATKNIDASVTAGKTTPAQAVTQKAALLAKITAQVDAIPGVKAPVKPPKAPEHEDKSKGKKH